MAGKSFEAERVKRRQRNRPWKRIYGVDRAYTARVDRARARGQFTPSPKTEEAA